MPAILGATVRRRVTPAEVADLRFVLEKCFNGKTLEEFLATRNHPEQESDMRMRFLRAAETVRILEYLTAEKGS